MSHRYERISHADDEDLDVHGVIASSNANAPVSPSSPPSIASSPPAYSLPVSPAPNPDLADSFDSPSDDEDDHDMRNHNRSSNNVNFQESQPLVAPSAAANVERPVYNVVAPSGRRVGGGQTDGVFANLSAKPTVGEKLEEHPPTYEQAAADATPPYWETTILTPGMAIDEVFIDGLPVGSVFAFVWNCLISMSFQLAGFLLTYLLHTTHAAKNGSRAGLGITLVQFGFITRGRTNDGEATGGSPPPETAPGDPNAYNFQGSPDSTTDPAGADTSLGRNEWLSYVLMVVGWFILIRAVGDFLRARRMEQLVLASPDRGLGVAVVAENEQPGSAV